jgi:peptidoglycan hydrolase-like protein with peptidoglycan-binding domain
MQAGINADGMFGPKTSEVLREFQESLRLPQQEPVDEATAQALNAPVGGVPAPGGPPSPDQVGKAAKIAIAGEQLDVAADSVESGGRQTTNGGGLLATDVSTISAGLELINAGIQIGQMGVSLKLAAASLREEGARQATTTTVEGSANPLVGLKRGDGLVFGTFERRPRVSLLQDKLNEQGGAGIESDGMFGPVTADALAAFQAERGLAVQDEVDADTADALTGAGTASTATGGLPSSLREAGEQMKAAAQAFVQLSTALVRAAAGLQSSGKPAGLLLGQTMSDASAAFAGSATFFATSGQALIDAAGDGGVASSTLRTAGARLIQAQPPGVDASQRFSRASANFAANQDSAVAVSFGDSANALFVAAQAIGDAGRAIAV